jgi:hypothetical protein
MIQNEVRRAAQELEARGREREQRAAEERDLAQQRAAEERQQQQQQQQRAAAAQGAQGSRAPSPAPTPALSSLARASSMRRCSAEAVAEAGQAAEGRPLQHQPAAQVTLAPPSRSGGGGMQSVASGPDLARSGGPHPEYSRSSTDIPRNAVALSPVDLASSGPDHARNTASQDLSRPSSSQPAQAGGGGGGDLSRSANGYPHSCAAAAASTTAANGKSGNVTPESVSGKAPSIHELISAMRMVHDEERAERAERQQRLQQGLPSPGSASNGACTPSGGGGGPALRQLASFNRM